MFRDEVGGRKQSLGGKPVIVSFLLELIDDLRTNASADPDIMTEWQIYKLIVDRLMIRDLHRSPSLDPDLRRQSLQRLAVLLSKHGMLMADEESFAKIIDDIFRSALRILSPEERRVRRDELFQDLRSSATLTRTERGRDGWFFSHNSLREYLVAEFLISRIVNRQIVDPELPISDAMRSFAGSLPKAVRENVYGRLRELWPHRSGLALGPYISLVWEMLRLNDEGLGSALAQITGVPIADSLNFSDLSVHRIKFDFHDLGVSAVRLLGENCSFSEVRFSQLNLTRSSFDGSVFDGVIFDKCSLTDTSFSGCFLHVCEFIAVSLKGADFRNLDPDTNFAIRQDGGVQAVSGQAAIGYLRYMGAQTDDVDPYFVWHNHPKFPIILKICENIEYNLQIKQTAYL
jgi:hypothetical protein